MEEGKWLSGHSNKLEGKHGDEHCKVWRQLFTKFHPIFSCLYPFGSACWSLLSIWYSVLHLQSLDQSTLPFSQAHSLDELCWTELKIHKWENLALYRNQNALMLVTYPRWEQCLALPKSLISHNSVAVAGQGPVGCSHKWSFPRQVSLPTLCQKLPCCHNNLKLC